MLTNPDEGSVKGKGAETMLPARGNPFRTAVPAGSTAPSGGGPAPASSAPSSAGTPDLGPEDLAKLFPETPAASAAASHDPAMTAALKPYENMPAPAAAPAPAAPPTAAAQPAASAAPAADMRQTGNNMFDPDIHTLGIQINPDAIGPKSDLFKAGAALTADDKLLEMFATDDRLRQCWNEADALEGQITQIPRMSLKLAQSLLDEVKSARNRLLNNRDQLEEAEREVAEVRYRLERIHRAKWFEQPSVIFWALCGTLLLTIFIAVIPLIFPAFFDLLAAQLERLYPSATTNIRLVDFWFTVVWGGLGGVTGAFYSLWQHVADKKDFDVDHSMWFYVNPLMGMMLGAFMYVLVMSGILTFLQSSPMVMYIMAWVVGFQQNVAFKLVNDVLKRLTPDADKGGGDSKAPSVAGGN